MFFKYSDFLSPSFLFFKQILISLYLGKLFQKLFSIQNLKGGFNSTDNLKTKTNSPEFRGTKKSLKICRYV